MCRGWIHVNGWPCSLAIVMLSQQTLGYLKPMRVLWHGAFNSRWMHLPYFSPFTAEDLYLQRGYHQFILDLRPEQTPPHSEFRVRSELGSHGRKWRPTKWATTVCCKCIVLMSPLTQCVNCNCLNKVTLSDFLDLAIIARNPVYFVVFWTPTCN